LTYFQKTNNYIHLSAYSQDLNSYYGRFPAHPEHAGKPPAGGQAAKQA
jgi:hypothetical protein